MHAPPIRTAAARRPPRPLPPRPLPPRRRAPRAARLLRAGAAATASRNVSAAAS